MATFRLGNNLEINDSELNHAVEMAIARTVTKYKKAGDKANKEIRTLSTIKWFRGFDCETMLSYLDYSVTVKQRNQQVIIEFESYINNYNANHTSLYKWNIRHGNPLNPADFIIDLQYNQGIIGLPAKSSQTGWVNTHFHQFESLYRFTTQSYKHLWASTVLKYL